MSSITVVETNMIVRIAETNTIVRVEKGLIGPQGIAGEGFPAGGTTGQVLAKIDATDYNTIWSDAGSGDMSKALYDPTLVEDDVFDMDNMVEGTSKILTTAERTKISNSALSGANTDITSLTGITGNISSINVLNFDIAPTNTVPIEGDVWWSADDHTLNIQTSSDPILQIGQEMYIFGKDNTGSGLSNGNIVFIAGAAGSRPIFNLAQADEEATSRGTIAMITHTITSNGNGYGTFFGLVRGLDTTLDSESNATTEGQVIYLSDSVLGGWTNEPPMSPNHLVVIGYIVRKHVTEGIIFIKINNGWETYELHDIDETIPTITGQILAWNDSTKKYELNTHINDSDIHKTLEQIQDDMGNNVMQAADEHTTVVYSDVAGTISIGHVGSIIHLPTALSFGNATQSYDITGNTWIPAVSNAPDEGSPGHTLSDCITAISIPLDDEYLHVREGTGVDPLTVEFTFNGSISTFDTIKTRSYYAGSVAHQVVIELWDGSDWDIQATFAGESGYVVHSIEVLNPASYIITNTVLMRYRHVNNGVASHDIQFDYVTIIDGGSAGGGGIPPASAIPYTPSGDLTATNVQTGLDELESTKVSYTVNNTIDMNGNVIINYAASTTSAGIQENTTTAEINSGTTLRTITPDALKASNIGTAKMGIVIVRSTTPLAIGNGLEGMPIPAELNGYNLVSAIAVVHDKGITSTTNIQIRRRRAGSDVDMLDTEITIGDEFFAADGSIDTDNDDVITGDLIYTDINQVHSGTPPNGLSMVYGFRLP